jgi:hypothetical protein
MEKIRFKQAQALLKESGKSQRSKEQFNTPHEGTIDSDAFEEILNKLIDVEEFLFTSRPSHHLSVEDAGIFCGELLNIRNKIDDMLTEFGVLEKKNVEDEIKKLSERFIFLTSKGNFKKLLNRWGVESQRIVVAGVPLEAEDMLLINPKIPEEALDPIKKKIFYVKNDLKRKMDQFQVKDILVVVENDKAGEVLAKRAEIIYGARRLETESLKDMNVHEFGAKLKNY